jgi:hypothetical protein
MIRQKPCFRHRSERDFFFILIAVASAIFLSYFVLLPIS